MASGIGQELACLGEPDLRPADENRKTDDIFNPPDDLADPWLTDVQTLGRPAEMAFLRDHQQRRQIGQKRWRKLHKLELITFRSR